MILIFNFHDDDMYYLSLTCSQVHPSTTACCDVIAGFSLPVCTMLMQLMIDMVLFSIEVTILIVKMSKLDIKPHAVKYQRIGIGTDSQKLQHLSDVLSKQFAVVDFIDCIFFPTDFSVYEYDPAEMNWNQQIAQYDAPESVWIFKSKRIHKNIQQNWCQLDKLHHVISQDWCGEWIWWIRSEAGIILQRGGDNVSTLSTSIPTLLSLRKLFCCTKYCTNWFGPGNMMMPTHCRFIAADLGIFLL